MGANAFTATVEDDDTSNAKTAFWVAVQTAQDMSGHGGYSGTIAEKDSFEVVSYRVHASAAEAEQAGWAMVQADDPRIADKWGPAGAIAWRDKTTGASGWVFFGWASS